MRPPSDTTQAPATTTSEMMAVRRESRSTDGISGVGALVDSAPASIGWLVATIGAAAGASTLITTPTPIASWAWRPKPAGTGAGRNSGRWRVLVRAGLSIGPL